MADGKSCFVTTKDELEEAKSSLKIKLKLPNKLVNSVSTKEDEDKSLSRQPLAEEEAATVAEEEVKLQVSPSCNNNKGFSNVKTLENSKIKVNGVANVALTTTTTTTTTAVVDWSTENRDEVINNNNKCPMLDCGKEFRTKRALFGHMRSHPGRDWRGMNPPSSEMVVAPVRVETWKATGKRGRDGRRVFPVTYYDNSAGSSGKSELESESEAGAEAEAGAEIVEVANILLLLASGVGRDEYKGDYDADEVKRAKKGKGLMNNINSNNDDENYYLKSLGYLANYKVNHDYNDCGEEVIKLKQDDYEEEEEKEETIRVIAPIGTKIVKKVEKIISSTNNHKIKSTNLESSMEINKHVCTTCGKAFPTHQALGGHRSSHNKDKYNKNNGNNNNNNNPTRIVVDGSRSSNPEPITNNGGGSGGGGGGGGGAKVMVKDNKIHEHKCKICEKIFESGQALGGHQRCHYVPSTDVLSSSPGQSNNQTGRVGRIEPIDLNLEPPMDEDEGDDDIIRADFSNNKYHSQ